MNQEFEDRLRDGLAEQNANIEIHGAGPDAAVSRGMARAKHTGIARGLAALVVAAGLGAMAYTQFTDGPDQVIEAASEDATTTTIANEDSRDGDDGADTAEGTEFGISMVEGRFSWHGKFLTDDGQLIQITTKPGQTYDDLGDKHGLVVTVSNSEGILESNNIPEDVLPTAMTFHDGVLYAVSTTPGTVSDGGGDVVISRSSDNGKSWSKAQINMEDDLRSDFEGVWRNTSIDANDAGVLVAVQSNYWFDHQKLLPQYAPTEESNFEIRETATGLEVRDYTEYYRLSEERGRQCESDFEREAEFSDEDWAAVEECWSKLPELPEPEVLESFTWEELGIEGTPRGEEFALYFSPTGTDFVEVRSPMENASGYLQSGGSAFIMTVWETERFRGEYGEDGHLDDVEEGYVDTSRIYRSTDGRNWTKIEGAPGWCGTAPSQGDMLLSYSCDEQNLVHFSNDGGVTWIKTAPVPEDPRPDYNSYSNVYAGDIGLLAIRTTEVNFEVYSDEVEALERRAEADGSWEEIERMYNELSDRSIAVFFSVDGQTWSEIKLPAEVAENDLWNYDAIVGANEIVVTLGGNRTTGPQTLFLAPK